MNSNVWLENGKLHTTRRYTETIESRLGLIHAHGGIFNEKIGIIGGIGPESTIDYYKLIIGAFHEKYADLGYPEIIIYSANLASLMKILEDKKSLVGW